MLYITCDAIDKVKISLSIEVVRHWIRWKMRGNAFIQRVVVICNLMPERVVATVFILSDVGNL